MRNTQMLFKLGRIVAIGVNAISKRQMLLPDRVVEKVTKNWIIGIFWSFSLHGQYREDFLIALLVGGRVMFDTEWVEFWLISLL